MARLPPPVRQILPGQARVQQVSRDVVERRMLALAQILEGQCDGDAYGLVLTQLQSQDLYRTQINLNNRWAFGVMNGNSSQITGPGMHGNKNSGNALFWRDLMLGEDRMFLDGDGQLRVQSASPVLNAVNNCFLIQATSDAGNPQNGFGVGMVFQGADNTGDIPFTGYINCINSDGTHNAVESYLAFSARTNKPTPIVELLQLWGNGNILWRGRHQGCQQTFKFQHYLINMGADANLVLSSIQMGAPILEFYGAITADRNVTAPLDEGSFFILYNDTSGGHNLVFGGATGFTVTVASTKKCIVYCDGTSYVRITADA